MGIKYIGKNSFRIMRNLRYGLLMLCFITVSGCSFVNQAWNSHIKISELKTGEKAFYREKYSRADAVFARIVNDNASPAVENIALYNLACTKLALAENDADLIEAIELLNRWNSSKPAKADPLFAVRGLRRIVDLKEQERLERLKKNEEMNTIVKNKNNKIEELKKLIETLQYQISELENIDQEIQQKRNTN